MSVVHPTRATIPALVLASAVAFAGCEVNLNSEGIVSRETKTFKVTGSPQVQLDTFDGSIEIHSWDRDEVEVEIEKRAMEQSLVDDMTVSADQQGDSIVLKVSGPRRQEPRGIQVGINVSPTARLRVAVPRKTQVTAASGDGSISIEDVDGKIVLNTTDGSVRGTRLAGDVTVRSGDGSIRMDRVEGRLDLETEDGSVTAEIKPTALRVKTSDGTLRIDIDSDSAMDADWDLQTDDGSVVLHLPADFNAELDAETSDGSVRATHPRIEQETRSGESREERRRTLRARLGSGGKTLRVRTGDGSIRIDG